MKPQSLQWLMMNSLNVAVHGKPLPPDAHQDSEWRDVQDARCIQCLNAKQDPSCLLCEGCREEPC